MAVEHEEQVPGRRVAVDAAEAQALIRLGFVEALGMDIDSSANINWRGTSLNRPDYQRLIPTGIIAFRRRG